MAEQDATTSPSANKLAAGQPKCRLFKLPAKIRNEIYELAFTSSAAAAGQVDIFTIATPPLDKDLLVTCRKVYDEARGIYRGAHRQYWATTEFVMSRESSKARDKDLDEKGLAHVRNLSYLTTAQVPMIDHIDSTSYQALNDYMHLVESDTKLTMKRYAHGHWVCEAVDDLPTSRVMPGAVYYELRERASFVVCCVTDTTSSVQEGAWIEVDCLEVMALLGGGAGGWPAVHDTAIVQV